jgi:integrase
MTVRMDYTLAKLHKPKSGKDWYVYYTFLNPETDKMQLLKERQGINRLKSDKDKKHHGALLVKSINEFLNEGWSPFAPQIVNEFDKLKLTEVLAELLKVKAGSVRKRTSDHYIFTIRLFTEYLTSKNLTSIKAKDFSKTLAQGFSDHLIIAKKYKGKSHNNQIAAIKALFGMMAEREAIDKNPFLKIEKKSEGEGRVLFYNDKQKAEIKDYLIRNDHPMYLFVQFIYYCFIRPNELMQIQVKHIDFENQTIMIPAYAAKNRKNSVVSIKDELFKLVKDKYKNLEPDLYLFGKGLSPNITPVHRNRASKSHQEVLKDLKLSPDFHLYDWKHTGARNFILSGRNIYDLMRYMRHSSLEQTAKYLRSLGLGTEIKANPNAWTF